MNQSRWFFHPIFVFIFSIIALGTSLFLYIYWYIEVSSGLQRVIDGFDIQHSRVLAPQTWLVILILSILVAMILFGIFTIFVFHQKTLQLYRLQNNFINNFTHELKTPVTSLKLYLETFLKYELPKNDQRQYIQYMLQDAQRLSDNINRMLNLARIETGTYRGEFVSADLAAVISQFIAVNHHLFPKCQITFHPPSDGLFFYPINLILFEMLLNNLISNAATYNHSEAPHLDIRFVREKRHFHIRFEDNGIGIEKSELKKIFRKFYQIGRSDNMTARGSGVGLYFVQTIAKIHKGKVVAESPGEGKGSVFSLILPYSQVNHDQTF